MKKDSTGDDASLQKLADEFGLGDISTIYMPQNIIDKFYTISPNLRPIARGTTAATPIVVVDSSDDEEEDGFSTDPGSPLQTTSINPPPVNPAPVNPAPARRYISQAEQVRDCRERRIPRMLQHHHQ